MNTHKSLPLPLKGDGSQSDSDSRPGLFYFHHIKIHVRILNEFFSSLT